MLAQEGLGKYKWFGIGSIREPQKNWSVKGGVWQGNPQMYRSVLIIMARAWIYHYASQENYDM